jgi:hypothetical protein
MRLRLKLNANPADGLIAGYTDVDSYYHGLASFDAPPALWPAGTVGILLGSAQERECLSGQEQHDDGNFFRDHGQPDPGVHRAC